VVTLPGDNSCVDSPSQALGTLLVRAWIHERTLLARIIRTPDVASVPAAWTVVASRRALHQEIDMWLSHMGWVDDEGFDGADH